MALRCLCGASYGTKDHLFAHAVERGHMYKCHCGSLLRSEYAYHDHPRTATHTGNQTSPQRLSLLEQAHASSDHRTSQKQCGLCIAVFQKTEDLDGHLTDEHHACPTCHQISESENARVRHQRSMTHCFCAEHDWAYGRTHELALHKIKFEHVTGFECIVCDKSFQTARAMHSHLASEGHSRKSSAASKKVDDDAAARAAIAEREEKELRCVACDRSFFSLNGLKRHRLTSRIHKPLCELECPLSGKCGRVFYSPSALLNHLESGKCKSGITHGKLNAVIFEHDTGSQLTDAFYRKFIVENEKIQSSIDSSKAMRSLEGSISHLSLDHISITSGSVVEIEDDASSTASSETVTALTPSASDSASVGSDRTIVLTPPASDLASVSDDSTVVLTPRGSEAASISDGGIVILTPSVNDAASVSDDSTPQFTPTTSEATDTSSESIVILTPTSSMASPALSASSTTNGTCQFTPSVSSLSDFIDDTTEVRYDPRTGQWPCNHPHCDRTFYTKWKLLKHMDSPVHLPHIFHCPTSMPGLSKPDDRIETFKTMSGLVQHMEAGVCNGGEEGLRAVADVVEKVILDKMGLSVTLLD